MHCVRLARRAALPFALAVAAACVSTARRSPEPPIIPPDTARVLVRRDTAPPIEQVAPPTERRAPIGRAVRIALAVDAPHVTLSGTGAWGLYDTGGESTLIRAPGGDLWTVEARRGLLRAVHDDGGTTPLRRAPFIARALDPGALVVVNGRRYRGEVWVLPASSGVLVVNRVNVEDYLRGVVPLEIGTRTPAESAAVAAQAVAARSYAYSHLADPSSPYDMVATTLDQVYGGVDAETPLGNAAVAATEGLVLMYQGRIVNAPYHSTCGGRTAGASEVWQGTHDEPYLLPVSDRIPGTDRYYCDIAPRFRWTQSFTASALRTTLDRYLRRYVAVTSRSVGTPRAVEVMGRTPSGRVRALRIITDRGRYTLRGNQIRFVLRSSGGEILNSTYFSVETERGRDGALRRLVLRGSGYGHGIGMCQWGAIGRARAGQDYRTILHTYYPGTIIASVAE